MFAEKEKQLSIFDELQKLDDIQMIEKTIFDLNVGDKIVTTSCIVIRTERFIEVKNDFFEEIFRDSEDALSFINGVFDKR